MAQPNETIQKVFVAVITAMVTILATLAVAGSDSVSRTEVQAMIKIVEDKQDRQIGDMRVKLEQILAEQIRTTTKLELLMKK